MDLLQILDLIVTIAGGLVIALGAIAPLTPATWDDKIVESLKSFVSFVKVKK